MPCPYPACVQGLALLTDVQREEVEVVGNTDIPAAVALASTDYISRRVCK